MDERRSMPRWQINQEAELKIENAFRAIPCVVEDIGPGGIRISLKRNLFDDVFSNFKLALSGDFELNAGAQVVWHDQTSEKNIYGLSFNRIEDSTRSRIGQFIQEKFPDVLVRQWWKGA